MSGQEKTANETGRAPLRFYWNQNDDPELDLASDEVLITEAAAGNAGLHFYSWDTPTVVLGYNQSIDDVDPEIVERRELSVVRRASGGSGVLHRRDIGVSLALSLSHPGAGGIRSLYQLFAMGVSRGLWALGVPGETVPFEDTQASPGSKICFLTHGNDSVLLFGKKIFGSAQIRRAGAVLIHGTLLIKPDLDLHAAAFRVPSQEITARVTGAGILARNRTRAVGVLAKSIAEIFGYALAEVETRVSEEIQPSESPIITE